MSHVSVGTDLDLILIILAFMAGRMMQYKEVLYLIIFLLRLSIWIAKKSSPIQRKHIEDKLDKILKLIKKKHNLPEEEFGAG